MIFVIDRRKSVLRHQGGCLVLERPDEKPQQVPVNVLEQVVVYGNPRVDTTVWRVLAEAGVSVVMLEARGQPRTAMLAGGLAVQLPLRRRQHRLADRPEKQLAMSKWFVECKFEAYDLPLAALSEAHGAGEDIVEEFRELRDRSRQSLRAIDGHAGIMGLEGQLAKAWFALLARVLPSRWKFTGRNRRPPRDPVNSMLSLGYTLMLSEVHRGVVAAGFDPSLGFLHADYPGRESFSLDFTELFRAGVDDFVLRFWGESIRKSPFFTAKSRGAACKRHIARSFTSAGLSGGRTGRVFPDPSRRTRRNGMCRYGKRSMAGWRNCENS